MKTVVIGGGPAGMMAAISAADAGDEVILLEKNEKLGKKLFITGKGRCNVTNACDRDTFFGHVVSNPKFMYSAYSVWDCYALMDFIESNHTPLKIERGNRVFPVSDHSFDIIDAFKKALKDRNVKVRLNTGVEEILTAVPYTSEIADERSGEELPESNTKKNSKNNSKKDLKNANLPSVSGVKLKDGEVISADKIILATGGKSYPSTGSTGDGYRFAKEFGHEIIKPRPALVPFETKEDWVLKLQGLTLKNVKLSLVMNEKCVYEEQGEMLFTHFGISGPLVLSASSVYASKIPDEEKNNTGYVLLDLKPALTEEEFDARLIRELEAGNRKELKNILNEIYPSKLSLVIGDITGLDPFKRCNEISAKERKKLLEATKRLRITVTGTRDFNEAIITHGGVSTKDVNPKTMESKRIHGLYFAGEVLDLDAFTGGFNLQIAFSTGYLAGSTVLR